MKISILIPYYNEKENILQYEHMLFPIVDNIMREYGYDYEYVFFDDGSDDGGGFEVLKYMLKMGNVKSCRNYINLGLGASIRNGIFYCGSDYIIVMDADLSYRPVNIRDMLECLKNNPDVDCISSSPYQYHTRRVEFNVEYIRHLGSVWFNKLYSVIIGNKITCATSMFRLYKTSVIKNMKLDSVGFDINAEILSEFIITNKKVIEIPIMLYSRDYGFSKMDVKYEVIRAVDMIFKILLRRLGL